MVRMGVTTVYGHSYIIFDMTLYDISLYRKVRVFDERSYIIISKIIEKSIDFWCFPPIFAKSQEIFFVDEKFSMKK